MSGKGSRHERARKESLHRARHARRHLEVRCAQERTDRADWRSLREGDSQRGRHQLGGQGGDWEFDDKYNSANPAEELLQINQGDDFGWPYCYYSVDAGKL